MRFARAVGLATLLLTACGPSANPAATPPSSVGSLASPVASPNADPRQSAIDEVMREAAAYAGVAATDVTLQQADARQWSDSSLGCPVPGQMYLQVITPGYMIVVQAGGRVLEYHTDARGRPKLCQEH